MTAGTNLTTTLCAQEQTQIKESKAERDARMAWWREARFGMFIHWGVYSAAAGSYKGRESNPGEWLLYNLEVPLDEYKTFAKKFNPVNYTPEDWVIMAKNTGMKYIVITSKHHEGFALFDSKVTDWDVVDATPYGKDLIKPLADACHKHGMKLGFYYSQDQDWTHPGGGAYKAKWDKKQEGDFTKYVKEISMPQVREILSNYGDIDILWWDTPCKMTPELAAPLYNLAHELQPGIITNNRLGAGFSGDSETPEQFIPATGYGADRDWEVCMTLNNTWGYSEHDKDWKSPEKVIKNLVDIVSKGGNYLINMGPKADGSIPVETVNCFKEVGQWMHINGNAIYNTTASPFKRLSWGRCTKRFEPDGTKLYLHVFEWPEDGTLLLPGLRNSVRYANTLWEPNTVECTSCENGTLVKVGNFVPGNLERPQVIELKLNGVLNVESVVTSYDSSKDFRINVSDAELSGKVNVEQKDGKESLGYWTEPKEAVEWNFKLSQAGTFDFVTETACEHDSKLTITIGDKTEEFAIKSTGSYNKFDTDVKLGTWELPANTKIKMVIKPVADNWSPVNLRNINVVRR